MSFDLLYDDEGEPYEEASLLWLMQHYADLPRAEFVAEINEISWLRYYVDKHNGADEPQIFRLAMVLGDRYRQLALHETHTRPGVLAIARDWFHEAMKLAIRVRGRRSLPAIEARLALTQVYCESDDRGLDTQCERNFRFCLAELTRILGPAHVLLAWTYTQFALLWCKREDYEAALTHFENALAIYENYQAQLTGRYDIDLIDTSDILQLMGLANKKLGYFECAWEYFNRAFNGRVLAYGLYHRGTLDTLGRLGEIHEIEGDHDGADEINCFVLEACYSLLGACHPQTLYALVYLGVNRFSRGQIVQGYRLLELGCLLLVHTLGSGHPGTSTAAEILASVSRWLMRQINGPSGGSR